MRITRIREQRRRSYKRSVATLVWERTRRPPLDLYMETQDQHADVLEASANAFLTASIHAATYHFERRIIVEDNQVCPTLVSGLEHAMDLQYEWYRDAPPVKLEVERSERPWSPSPLAKPAIALSGGVDSLSAVRSNRLKYGADSEESYKYGLVIDAGWDVFEADRNHWYWTELAEAMADEGVRVIPMATNIRDVNRSHHFFVYRLFGAQVAALGHAARVKVRSLGISSDGADVILQGSHPQLDPLYSSGAVEIQHVELSVDRIEKLRRLTEWPVARALLRVCWYSDQLPQGQINCGQCEKCLRTMLALSGLGQLGSFQAFNDDLSVEKIREHLTIKPDAVPYYEPIIELLRESGENNLADCVRTKLEEARSRNRAREKIIKRLDRVLLGSFLRRTRRRSLLKWPGWHPRMLRKFLGG